MSEASTSEVKKPMEQPNNNLSKSMGQLSANSDKTSTQPKSLSDMPVDVGGLIIERLDYKQQLKLRKVSKSLRALVDNQKPACKTIHVDCNSRYDSINFDNDSVIYTSVNPEDDSYIEEDSSILVKRADFEKVAFDDLASTFRNPKLQLDKFDFWGYVDESKDIEQSFYTLGNVFGSLNHQVSVRKVYSNASNPSCLISILPYLKPGLLEHISISPSKKEVDWRSDPIGMNLVALLEQWKQAEELELRNCFDDFPMEYAKHFKRFHINEDKINGGKFVRVMEYFSQLDNFEHCTLTCFDFHNRDFVHGLLGAPISSNTTEEVFHHPISNSDNYLEFTKPTRGYYFTIEKKKREDN